MKITLMKMGLIIFFLIALFFVKEWKIDKLSGGVVVNHTLSSLIANSIITEPYEIKKLSLQNSMNVYFVLRNADYCGSGGCTYYVLFGSDIKEAKQVIGFDSYNIDCDTKKISFIKGNNDNIFGALDIDEKNKIVRVYYSAGGGEGQEHIYHFAQNGNPTLIASYSNICDVFTVKTLFRSSEYKSDLTTYWANSQKFRKSGI